jgi:hypothetical protein
MRLRRLSWRSCGLAWRFCSGWCSAGRRRRASRRRARRRLREPGAGRRALSGVRGRGRGGGISRTCPGFRTVWDFPGGGYYCSVCGCRDERHEAPDPGHGLAGQARAGAQYFPGRGDAAGGSQPGPQECSLQRELAAAPEAAHAALRIEFEAVTDALRPGMRATVQELAITKRPWPSPLSEIKTPVHQWHGELDRNTPIAFACGLAMSPRSAAR